jgi:hypothetical protein
MLLALQCKLQVSKRVKLSCYRHAGTKGETMPIDRGGQHHAPVALYPQNRTPGTRWGSSVSTVSDYGLDDQEIGFRSPAGAKDFSSNLCVQTSFEAHPASCTMGTGGPFPRAMLTTHLHLVPRSRMSWSYTSSPPKRHHGV